MIGTFAVYNDELFFSESMPKNTLMVADFPLENWMQRDGSIFIPLTTTSVGTPKFCDELQGELLPKNHDFPRTCGVTVFPNRSMQEIAVRAGKLVWRNVPWGPGTIYISSVYEDFEKALYAALLVTRDLKKAVELASAGSAVTSNKHVFTHVSAVAYAAHMKDPGLIRTISRAEIEAIVFNQLELNKMLEKEDD